MRSKQVGREGAKARRRRWMQDYFIGQGGHSPKPLGLLTEGQEEHGELRELVDWRIGGLGAGAAIILLD